MNAFFGIGIIAAIIYSLFIDMTFLKIYAILLIFYIILTQLGISSKYNDFRKRSNIASWNGIFNIFAILKSAK